MATYKTAMCISPTLNWQGSSDGPVAVYDAATLTILGMTDGPVHRMIGRGDGHSISLHVSWSGASFAARREPAPSQWYVLEHVE